MPRDSAKMSLPSADELLFSTQDERETTESVREIPLEQIHDFPDHPFKVKMDEKMAETVESIRRHGVLVPAIVRPRKQGGYEMVSGHRRKRASSLLEKTSMPCIVRDLTDDEATIIMVDSNLQREEVLPSEKAFAYRMKLEAMKRQGQRTDLTSDPPGPKLRSNERLAKDTNESISQIKRYIRLTYLIQPLLDMVDDRKIALRPAVELSYLPTGMQEKLFDVIRMEDCTPSHAQAIKMRKFAEDGRLNENVILSIMAEEKGNQKEQFHIPKDRLARYFPAGTPAKQMEDTIIKALELYRKREKTKER